MQTEESTLQKDATHNSQHLQNDGPHQVQEFLKTLDVEDLWPQFREARVNSMDVVIQLESSDLDQMNIPVGAKRQIINGIQNVKQTIDKQKNNGTTNNNNSSSSSQPQLQSQENNTGIVIPARKEPSTSNSLEFYFRPVNLNILGILLLPLLCMGAMFIYHSSTKWIRFDNEKKIFHFMCHRSAFFTQWDRQEFEHPYDEIQYIEAAYNYLSDQRPPGQIFVVCSDHRKYNISRTHVVSPQTANQEASRISESTGIPMVSPVNQEPAAAYEKWGKYSRPDILN